MSEQTNDAIPTEFCRNSGDHEPLFDPTMNAGLARNSDPDTSHEAAAKVDANKLEAIWLYWLRSNYGSNFGMTADEISENSQLPLNTISPRSAPLRNKGFIYDSGERRKTRSNRNAIVWRLK